MCLGGSGALYHLSLLMAGNEVFNKGEPQERGGLSCLTWAHSTGLI